MASNNFRKSLYTLPCVWLRKENIIFWKSISFDRKIKVLTRKLFYVSIFTSNHFRTQTRKERERERERESRKPSTSHNQTRQRDHALTPDAPTRLCRQLRTAEIAPHEAYRRLTGLVLLWVDLVVRHSPIYLLL